MPTEKDGTAEALTAQLERMSNSVEQLSARIARLATLLDVNLQNDNELDRLLNMDGGIPGGHERRVSALPPAGPERRKSNQQEELRALLVLRYGVSRRYVERVGVQATRCILVNAQDQLELEGFKPGAAGVDLRRVFDGF
ncbi:hypothetical protein [Simplicispira psychrophila]|uniref:hypothetical protein n=1 Tax=Simplicispira psychrophila TaxID=80882 RepID=UPI000489B8E6|nr:hypothetical protein [Simplicispira psychrophila]